MAGEAAPPPLLPRTDASVVNDPGLPAAPGEPGSIEGAATQGADDAIVGERLFVEQMDAWVERNVGGVVGDEGGGMHPLERQSAPLLAEATAAAVALHPRGETEPVVAAPVAPVPPPVSSVADIASALTVPAATPTPADAPTTPPEVAPTGVGVTIDVGGGQMFTVGEDAAKELVGLYRWHQERADVMPVVDAIRNGDVVALSSADYQRLVELARTPAPAAQATPAPAAPPVRPTIDTRYLDPDVAALLQHQQAQIDALTAASTSAPAATPVAPVQRELDVRPVYQAPTPEQRRLDAELDRLGQSAMQVRGQFAQQFGLTDAEAARLVDVAVQSGDIDRLYSTAQQQTPWAVDAANVYSTAFHRAMVSDPSLRERYEATIRSQSTAPVPQGATPVVADINAKRARAASLAAVPSAATPATPVDVRALHERQIEIGIADELRQAFAG